MTQPRRPPAMKMTTILLSEEDHEVIDALKCVVGALTGVATLAAVVRYAIRRAAEMEETKQIAARKRRAKTSAKRKTLAEGTHRRRKAA